MKPVRLNTDKVISQEDNDIVEDAKSIAQEHPGLDNEPKLKPSGLWRAIALIIFVLAFLQLIEANISAFEVHYSFGIAILALSVGVSMLAVLQLIKFLKLKKTLVQHDHWCQQALQINSRNSHGQAIPLLKKIHSKRFSKGGAEFEKFEQKTELCQDDSEVLYLYSREILEPLDERAKAIISRHAIDSSVMIALSPFAAIDMLLVLWRNLRMVDQVAEVYGLRYSPFSKFRILKHVFHNMLLVGAQEIAMDATFDSLGLSLGSKVSARAAQGIGAGVISMRIGIKAIEYCRPIDLLPEEKIKVSGLRKQIVGTIKDRFLSLKKSD